MHVGIDKALSVCYNADSQKGEVTMLEFISSRVNDFNISFFVNELVNASKNLGILEAKIDSYQFNGILIPMLQAKEAV